MKTMKIFFENQFPMASYEKTMNIRRMGGFGGYFDYVFNQLFNRTNRDPDVLWVCNGPSIIFLRRTPVLIGSGIFSARIILVIRIIIYAFEVICTAAALNIYGEHIFVRVENT